MSIIVSVVGSNENSDEYKAAKKLSEIITLTAPRNAVGEIVIYASATLIGQEVKDVDLVVLGFLENCRMKLEFRDSENNLVRDNVDVNSFCVTVEIKSHSIHGISRLGTDFYVKYGNRKHSVTEQSNMQKIALMNFFNSALQCSPYITNLIWFTQIEKTELNELLILEQGKISSNVMSSDFSFTELIQLLVLQKRPYKTRSGYVFDCTHNFCTIDILKNALEIFSRNKTNMGVLTRKRIEEISSKTFDNLTEIDGDVLSIYRGRAGTGKTVGLIRTALNLFEKKDARVLILTYNKALVSDVRRLFALSDLPDFFSPSCISISTMQSYFYKIINSVLYNGNLEGTRFLSDYDDLILEFDSFLRHDEESRMMIQEACKKDCKLFWEYVLIDEAQDWSEIEKDIILNLFEVDKIVVADGGQQFVRNIAVCDWNSVQKRKSIKLRYCLRQKPNIIGFINKVTEALGINASPIIPSDKLTGGRIRIIANESKFFDVYGEEYRNLLNAGNIAYDMMLLVPHTMVVNNGNERYFAKKEMFESEGIFFWDGTNDNQRREFTTQEDEVRLLQYESARGLEGWTVFCLGFDVFLEDKLMHYDDTLKNDALLLESREERKRKYLVNWAQIPLTRAIDTLVITLENPNSRYGKMLNEISKKYSDYVEWIE